MIGQHGVRKSRYNAFSAEPCHFVLYVRACLAVHVLVQCLVVLVCAAAMTEGKLKAFKLDEITQLSHEQANIVNVISSCRNLIFTHQEIRRQRSDMAHRSEVSTSFTKSHSLRYIATVPQHRYLCPLGVKHVTFNFSFCASVPGSANLQEFAFLL